MAFVVGDGLKFGGDHSGQILTRSILAEIN
jgi:hypothetical protein